MIDWHDIGRHVDGLGSIGGMLMSMARTQRRDDEDDRGSGIDLRRVSISGIIVPIIVGALSAAGATMMTVTKIETTLDIRFGQQSKEIEELKVEVREHRSESQTLRERVLRHEVEDEMRQGKNK